MKPRLTNLRFLYWLGVLCISFCGTQANEGNNPAPDFKVQAVEVLRKKVLSDAEWALQEQSVTVTARQCPRSAGGKHDFYSEGDYWWPDPANADGPYIQRDGMSNPENFVAHRQAMIRFSRVVGALASAYCITGDDRYVRHALAHCRAWFVDKETLMNPNLLYTQAIKGRATGRGIGIIDTIHLMEVVQGVTVMQKSPAMNPALLAATKAWFAEYLQWLTAHPHGMGEMNEKNNHGTCWVMQVAAFAKFTSNESMMEFCRKRYKDVLLPHQMAADGSFPLELKRTKPYGYSLFNLDAMTTICQLLSTPGDNLWTYKTPQGLSIRDGIAYLHPFIADKSRWPFQRDVMYWDQWPVAQPSLFFGAHAFRQQAWFDTWNRLEHAPTGDEVLRNLPVRNPLIWLQ